MMLITTLVVLFLVCCRLEVRCGYAGVVSGLQAKAQLIFSFSMSYYTKSPVVSAARTLLQPNRT